MIANACQSGLNHRVWAFLAAMTAVLVAVAGNATNSEPLVVADRNSAGAFVQDFYDWYSPLAFRQKESLPWNSVLTQRRDLFALKLVYALKRDSLASANIDGTYTGLDVDPFLNTENPCEHYLVAQVLEYTKSFRAEVKPICNGKLQAKTAVTAEVVFNKDRWQFTNFYYPEGQDLLRVLGELRKERRNDLK